MQVAKWGNSLAVRLPAKQVERLELKEGDEVEVIETERGVELRKKLTREERFAQLRKYRGLIPADYKFNRDDAYDEPAVFEPAVHPVEAAHGRK